MCALTKWEDIEQSLAAAFPTDTEWAEVSHGGLQVLREHFFDLTAEEYLGALPFQLRDITLHPDIDWRDYEDIGVLLDSLLPSFGPEEDVGIKTRWLSSFSHQQATAIIEWLRYAQRQDRFSSYRIDIDEVLEYWTERARAGSPEIPRGLAP